MTKNKKRKPLKLKCRVYKYKYGIVAKVTGYINGRSIGQFVAEGEHSHKYLTVQTAYLQQRWTGKGYGHPMYRRLARQAVSLGFSGLRSICCNRSESADGAWAKIRSHSAYGSDYLVPGITNPKKRYVSSRQIKLRNE